MSLKYKLFRNPVHGDIEIERWICSEFIDSEVFQRLRFIEQSSMRMLFPGARHDRFIHSIGTFLMAKRIFDALQDSIRVHFEEETVHEFRNTFLIAALLHDCAHSPFSHTGELRAKYFCQVRIDELLKKTVADADFQDDLPKAKSATHEKASAYVAYTRFAETFRRHSINAVQLARMIMGLKNLNAETDPKLLVYNCLIGLVNGFIVDVDRLDYLERDTWATGIRNASVDLERLISGLEIDFKAGEIMLNHRATSSLLNAVAARDYFYQWVLPHHKVSYANEVLVRAIDQLVEVLSKRERKGKADVGRDLFSPERLLPDDRKKVAHEVIHLPTDGDLIYLMKKYIPDDPFFRAYSERRCTHISLWKTHAEFMHLFGSLKARVSLKDDFWTMFSAEANRTCEKHGGFCTEASPIKVSRTKMSEVKVILKGKDIQQLDLTYMFGKEKSALNTYYMNAYIGVDEGAKKEKLVAQLKSCFDKCVTKYVSIRVAK